MEASKSWAAFVTSSDEESFSAIYTAHGTMVWRICHRILGPGEEVDDAFQGTWIRLLVAVRDQQSELSRSGADLVLARLAALEANRVRQQRNRLHQREVAMDPLSEQNTKSINGQDSVSRKELATMVESAMAEQPEIYRTALELHYLDGLTQQQVATVLQVPTGTVATRLRTGCTRLMAALKRMGITNGGAALVAAGAMVTPVTLPAAIGVYTNASTLSAKLSPATVDFSIMNGSATAPLLTTKAAIIATLFLIPLAIVMAIYFQPPSRLDSLTNVGSSKAEEVTPSEPITEKTVAPPPVEKATPTPTATPAAVAAEAEGSLTVEGVVLNEEGEPIEGTTVTAYRPVVGGKKAFIDLLPLSHTTTNKEGFYTINLDDEIFFIVTAKADNYAIESIDKSHETALEMEDYQAKTRKEIVNFNLEKGLETSILVRSESGKPIHAASLFLMNKLRNNTFVQTQEFKTDELGSTSLGRLASISYDLWARAEGYESQQLSIVPGEENLTVTMKEGSAILGGFVRHAKTGQPIAGATIRAGIQSTLDSDANVMLNLLPYRQGTTGTDGSYELTLSPGSYQVSPIAEGLQVINEIETEESGLVSLENGDRILNHDFEMGSNIQWVRGIVKDSATGEPLSDVSVTVNPAIVRIFQLKSNPQDISDAEGQFELEFSGDMIMAEMLQLKKEGYKLESVESLQLQEDTVEDAAVYTMTAKMSKISGGNILLVNSDDIPVGGAEIAARISQPSSGYLLTTAYGITNDEGIGSFAFPQDGFSAKFLIHHPEGFSFVKEDLTEEELVAKNPIKVIVPEHTNTSFLIVDSEGNPIPTAQITLFHQSYSNAHAMSGICDREGRLVISKIVPDVYNAVISANGFLTMRESITIGIDGDPKEPNTIVLNPSQSINGRVIDSSGQPLAGIEISVKNEEHSMLNLDETVEPRQLSDSEGRFNFKNIPYATATLTFESGQQNQRIAAKFGDEVHDYTFDLDSFVLFVGVVVDGETGEALKDFQTSISQRYRSNFDVSLQPTSSPTSKRLSTGTFTYEISPLSIDSVKVTVRAEGYAPLESPDFHMEPGKEVSYIFEMSPGATVTGRVVTAEGEPVAKSKVVALNPNRGLQFQLGFIFNGKHHSIKPVTTDSKGRFTMENVAPGQTNLITQPPGNYRQSELSVSILDGQKSQDIGDIVVTQGDVLKGVVLQLPDRSPVANVEVSASVMIDNQSPWERNETYTDKLGEFTMEGLSQGKTLISISHNGCSHSATKESNEWGFAEFLIGTESITGNATLDGKPHQLQITAKADGRHQVRTTIRSAEDFRLTGLQTGSYTITARSQQNQWERSTTVTVPTSEPVIINIVTQRVTGRLLDAEGNPVEGVQLSTKELRSDDPSYTSSFSWANTKADGSFTLEGVGPGRHKIRTYYKGASHDLTEFEISLGIDKDLGDVQLP